MGHIPAYIPGSPWAVCPRCGLDRRLNSLRIEWTGLRVCEECWDPRPDVLAEPHVRPEGVPRPDAQPEPAPAFTDPDVPLSWDEL